MENEPIPFDPLKRIDYMLRRSAKFFRERVKLSDAEAERMLDRGKLLQFPEGMLQSDETTSDTPPELPETDPSTDH